jgi:multiple sugar transport system permease protein
MTRRPFEPTAGAMASPGAIGAAVFILAPTAFILWLSLQDWDLIGSPLFVGWDNYTRILVDDRFGRSLATTLVIGAIAVPGIVICALVIARACRAAPRTARVALPLLAAPWLMAPFAAGTVWRWMISPSAGVLPSLLGHRVDGLSAPWVTPIAISMVLIWAGIAPAVLLLLSFWRSLPADAIDAAQLDGAGPLRRLTAIEIPLLTGPIGLVALGMSVQVFALFDQSFALAGTGSAAPTGGAGLLIYQAAFQEFAFGRAAAMSVVLATVQFAILAVVTRRRHRRETS